MRQKALPLSAFFLLAFLLFAFSAPLFSILFDLDPSAQNLSEKFSPPHSKHFLGQDHLGRDLFIRLLYASKNTLGILFFSNLLSLSFGWICGLLAGYLRGYFDKALIKISDFFLSLPLTPLLLISTLIDFKALTPAFLNLNETQEAQVKIIFLFSLFAWIRLARLTRAQSLSLSNKAFVESSKSLGAPLFRILQKDLAPNTQATVLVCLLLNSAHIVFFEAALNYLGLGLPAPTPSWGGMLYNAWSHFYEAPLAMLLPGLMIFGLISSLHSFALHFQKE